MHATLTILFLAVVAFVVIMIARKNQGLFSTGTQGVTAFAKIAEADAKAAATQGKIIAVKTTAEVKAKLAAELHAAALEAHQVVDEVHAKLDAVDALLG